MRTPLTEIAPPTSNPTHHHYHHHHHLLLLWRNIQRDGGWPSFTTSAGSCPSSSPSPSPPPSPSFLGPRSTLPAIGTTSRSPRRGFTRRPEPELERRLRVRSVSWSLSTFYSFLTSSRFLVFSFCSRTLPFFLLFLTYDGLIYCTRVVGFGYLMDSHNWRSVRQFILWYKDISYQMTKKEEDINQKVLFTFVSSPWTKILDGPGIRLDFLNRKLGAGQV